METATSELAERVAGLAPLAVRSMKTILGQVLANAVDEDQARELALICAGSADLAEGFAAQKEKREPRFRGA